MGDLSKHFSREEFACNCGCGFDTVDSELLKVLETIRTHFNKPIFITSGCRCEEHNASVSGSENSQHLVGRAADIYISGTDVGDIALYAANLLDDHGGVGEYSSWVHVDSRSGFGRW